MSSDDEVFSGESGDDDVVMMPDYPWNRSRMSSAGTDTASVAGSRADGERTSAKMFNEVLRGLNKSAESTLARYRTAVAEREIELERLIQEGRFGAIEHFLVTEFERQTQEMAATRESAVLDVDDADADGADALWYKKTSLKYEEFLRKVRVLRSAFLRTYDFFRELTESTVTRMSEKHAREVLTSKAIHSMTASGAADATAKHLEMAQTRERQALEISNVREANDRTSARELKLLEFHLRCTEELVLAEISMWRKMHELRKAHGKTLAARQLDHDEKAELTEKEERRRQQQQLKALRDDIARNEREEEVDTRSNERTRRHMDFAARGKGVATDALYKLTFDSKRAEYASDSMLDSQDSEEEQEDMESPFRSASVNVVMMVRLHRKRIHERRRTAKRAADADMAAVRTKLRAERRAALGTLRNDIERMYNAHVAGHARMTEDWNRERKQMDASHLSAMKSLTQKHAMDKQILIEADRQMTSDTQRKSDLGAQNAMSSHVFHEVRNVLASLLSIADSLDGCSPEELRQFAYRQKVICSYATETMSSMLDIVKYQGGVYQLELQPINLKDLARRAGDLQGDRVKAGVNLVCDGDDVVVSLDEHVVTQLLVNLLSNSSKFTDAGEIRVFARVASSKEPHDECDVELGVSDTGWGMDHDAYAKAGRDFKDDPNEYMTRCSGYGLYLTRLIARTMGGELNLVSPLPFPHRHRMTAQGGKGSVTSLTLRCSVPDTKRASIRRSLASTPREWRFQPDGRFDILIADDQKLVRSSILQLLSKLIAQHPSFSARAFTVRSAEEAMRVVRERPFDVVFMDKHFDQTLFAQAADSAESERPCVTLRAEDDRGEAIREFNRIEAFHCAEGDGNMTGDAFVRTYDGTAVCVLATGSVVEDLPDHVKVMKPFEVATFEASMESGASSCGEMKRRLKARGDALLLNGKTFFVRDPKFSP